MLVAVEAVQEAPRTRKDVKGWLRLNLFYSVWGIFKKEPNRPRKQAFILIPV